MTDPVASFERAFADHVGAEFGIALNSGTATLHTALVALGVKPGDYVAVPPLTMSATTIAVLHAGADPAFVDVDPRDWLMDDGLMPNVYPDTFIWVSLYGLQKPTFPFHCIDDAAQTLRPHGGSAFTSYSFQASKILSLGEGGMLVTNDEDLARRAREFSSLGYRMDPRQPRISKAALKHPGYQRHHSLGWNYRMSPLVAERGLALMPHVELLKQIRHQCADLYRAAIQGCPWLTPQHVPDGWAHDYWTFAVATDTRARCLWLLDAVERHGGERPYPAWRTTFQEPAFRHLALDGMCPVAEDLQPRLVQFQTNDLQSAIKNARALGRAIEEAG